jgi:hypothetical protein
MGPVGDPPALALNVFTRGDGRSRPHHRDEITMPTDFDPQDAEARLLTMERDALDRTREVFCGRGTGMALYEGFHGRHIGNALRSADCHAELIAEKE